MNRNKQKYSLKKHIRKLVLVIFRILFKDRNTNANQLFFDNFCLISKTKLRFDVLVFKRILTHNFGAGKYIFENFTELYKKKYKFFLEHTID